MVKKTAKERFFNYFRNIVETMPDSLIVVDSQGKVEFFNSQALRLLGYKKEEFLGKDFAGVIYEDFSFEEETALTAPFKTWEGLWRDKSGEGKPVLYTCALFKNKSGKVVSKIYFGRDLTELKKTEEELIGAYLKLFKTQEELIQSEKMAALGRIAAGIAHEIRNPLAIILQGIYLVDSLTQDKSNDLSETMGMIKHSVERANNVISKLLEYCRVHKLKISAENICSIIDYGLVLAERPLIFRNITIEKDYPPLPVRVNADKVMLSQVFLNLAINAIDAMPGGGNIKIKVYTDGDFCVVNFKDTGPGIAHRDLPRVFEPFYTTKEAGKGVGLGLAISRLVIEKHEGLINAENDSSSGTTFVIKIPLAK